MYITRVRLKNIRCFENIDLKFDLKGPKLSWTLILGDNATGKTTLLRAIAIGLCNEPSAAGLIKESEEGYIRRGEQKGRIEVWLHRSLTSEKPLKITTDLERIGHLGNEYEKIRKTAILNNEPFPYDDIFVCGYGAGRGTSGSGDISTYSAINAVYSLFNYSEGLQNPELMLHRLERPEIIDKVKAFLAGFMLGPKRKDDIKLGKFGITVSGPWGGDMALRDIADGYKASFLWLADLIGWGLSFDNDLDEIDQIAGIVLIDEIEQHLHPSWQQKIVENLRTAFPKVQFITTTHSPLIVSSVGQPTARSKDPDRLVYLRRDPETKIVDESIEITMQGWRADQILATNVFGYVISNSPELELILRRASILSGKGRKRTDHEEIEYYKLKMIVGEKMIGESSTPIEREIMTEMRKQLVRKVKKIERQLEQHEDD